LKWAKRKEGIAFQWLEIASDFDYLFKPSAFPYLYTERGISLAWSRICALGKPFSLKKKKPWEKETRAERAFKSAHDSGSNPECPTRPFL